MAYKGKFQPSNSKKYKGDPTNIVYRSLWERKFMVYCDKNENCMSGLCKSNICRLNCVDTFVNNLSKYK